MKNTDSYPVVNLFHSKEWKERTLQLGVGSPRFYLFPITRGVQAAALQEGLLSDFEAWPATEASCTVRRDELPAGTDWVVYRKLLTEQRGASGKPGTGKSWRSPLVIPYSSSPFLDLRNPPLPQKEKIAHVYRTERKLTREVAAPILREYVTDEEAREWLTTFCAFQQAQARLPELQRQLLGKWILGAPRPAWMKLLSLSVNGTALACGLFYHWDGVFYYYSSSMNPDPAWRKYGPGKLFVEKLIQHAKAQGADIFDFLQGDHEYKAHWNPVQRPLYQWIEPVSLKGAVALQLFRLKRTFA